MLAKEVKDLDEEVFERNIKELEKNGPFDNGNKSVDPKLTDKRIKSNDFTYEGQVNAKGEEEGRGIKIWSNGAIYEGFWHRSMPNGRGRNINSRGEMYIGDWSDEKCHGNGTLTWSDGMKYIGDWSDNKMHGNGTHTWSDGRKYIGDWSDGYMHGNGTHTWSDGRKYIGCLLYTSPSPRDATLSRMPSSA